MYSCHKPCFFRFLIFMCPFFTFAKLGRNVTFLPLGFPTGHRSGSMAGFILDSAVTLSALLLVAVALVEGALQQGGGWVGLVIFSTGRWCFGVDGWGWCFGAIQGVWFTKKKVNGKIMDKEMGNVGIRDDEIGRYWRVFRYCEAFGFLDLLAFREAMPIHGITRSQKFQPTSLREFL